MKTWGSHPLYLTQRAGKERCDVAHIWQSVVRTRYIYDTTAHCNLHLIKSHCNNTVTNVYAAFNIWWFFSLLQQKSLWAWRLSPVWGVAGICEVRRVTHSVFHTRRRKCCAANRSEFSQARTDVHSQNNEAELSGVPSLGSYFKPVSRRCFLERGGGGGHWL